MPPLIAAASGEAVRSKFRRGSSRRCHDLILLVNRELTPYPFCFFSHRTGRTAPGTWVYETPWVRTWKILAPRHPGAGNVSGRAVRQPPFGRADSPGAPTGWAIPPDPQQARGGEIPVQGGP